MFEAAWKMLAVLTGAIPYLSVKLDDPGFAASLYTGLLETDTEGLAVIRSRHCAVN